MIEEKYFSYYSTMPKQRVSSRRAKTESKKMFRQTILMMIASIAIIIIFLFLVLPTLLKFVSGQGGDTIFSGEDTIAPQTPIISAPVSATNSAKLTINGYGEKDATVYLILNGSERADSKVEEEDGKFEISVDLDNGENKVKLYAEDDSQNQSENTREYSVVFDNIAPTLELESPTDGQQIELRKNQVTTIKGMTEANAKVAINGRVTRADSEGSFSTTYQLQEGDNKLQFVITDDAGNSTEQEITVKFRL